MTTETKVQHTPGPWEALLVGPCETGDAQGVRCQEYMVHLAHGDRHTVARNIHGKANAHLIAAAPALLEALERINMMSERGLIAPEAGMTARAAIALAKGVQDAS